jgi:hypothetical protein
MKGDDPKVCSRCTFVEKIKAEDKELYGHISQNFKSSSGLLHAADKRP